MELDRTSDAVPIASGAADFAIESLDVDAGSTAIHLQHSRSIVVPQDHPNVLPGTRGSVLAHVVASRTAERSCARRAARCIDAGGGPGQRDWLLQLTNGDFQERAFLEAAFCKKIDIRGLGPIQEWPKADGGCLTNETT